MTCSLLFSSFLFLSHHRSSFYEDIFIMTIHLMQTFFTGREQKIYFQEKWNHRCLFELENNDLVRWANDVLLRNDEKKSKLECVRVWHLISKFVCKRKTNFCFFLRSRHNCAFSITHRHTCCVLIAFVEEKKTQERKKIHLLIDPLTSSSNKIVILSILFIDDTNGRAKQINQWWYITKIIRPFWSVLPLAKVSLVIKHPYAL